ncbi:hypothetical protein H4582DRAFT_580714 [Lactarius indigo]|nr:hypothetical protein H4582DRAFT_580714 [Lactarius indigo]
MKCAFFFFSFHTLNMSRALRPLPPIPQPPLAQRSSLDATDPPSSGSSTSALSDDCQPPMKEHALRYAVSLPIIPSNTSVKFAPLPEIGPRKRRSNYPLGVAARSQMLQQRRENARMQGIYRQPPLWSDVDERGMTHVPEEVQEEDPLEVLGKLIADKSKSLWKRVASKGNPSDKHAASGDVNEGATTHEEDHAVLPLGSLRCEELLPPPDPPIQTHELSNNNGSDTARSPWRRDSS